MPAKYIHTSVDAAAVKDKLVGIPPSLLAATGRMAFTVASGSAKGVGARVWKRDHYTRQLFYAFYGEGKLSSRQGTCCGARRS
jgi:hypothetical protein